MVAVQAMGIQKYIFCSIHNCEAFPSVPLMQIKACTEDFLKASSLDYTILRLCGFHQAIIGNYAVRLPPFLLPKSVSCTFFPVRTGFFLLPNRLCNVTFTNISWNNTSAMRMC